ncbi:hypothetical protein BV22DRAFT_1108559 [Leucogyrophana mollusca]|uniref:Uncharacterized protein n=1 Tax=Leucogyrophana mollusca TaxID=85980 RepID=A0ACB8AW69_9AGAM|nr:hypothetical protein BV22DRAFT_1108559 [Leucogyrophana mollusca]
MSAVSVEGVLRAFAHYNISVSSFIISLLETPAYQSLLSVIDLTSNIEHILAAFVSNSRAYRSTLRCASNLIKRTYARSISELARRENGWHFSALRASAKQLEAFRLEEMAQDMERLAPELWELLDTMLSADHKESSGPRNVRPHRNSMPTEEEDYWNRVDEVELGDAEVQGDEEPRDRKCEREERRKALKKVIIISILMQSTNQKCNAFESVMGIFLHSCNTPERVIHALARMGISVSVSAIHDAIRSLSRETYRTLRDMGQTLLVGYAYDNFDIDFKTRTPTIEKAMDTLTHMTSGDLIRLDHGVTLDDLRCSQYLWERSHLNPAIPAYRLPTLRTCVDLLDLHPEGDHPSGLTRRQRWNAYKFLADLVKYGPPYFAQFKNYLGRPESVEQIPVKKMQHAPARAMDINQSKVSGNIKAIANLLQQGGVGDPTEKIVTGSELTADVVDIQDYVVLFHGDLGTAERVQSVLERRSIEATPWRRYQFVVFVMGLFHLKMACADAIWRIFIEPKASRDDTTSLMHFIALHRPRETGKIGSDPGFRRMHEVIGHTGIALRLDAWRAEAYKTNSTWTSLEAFAGSEPSITQLREMANALAMAYVAGGEDVYEARCKPLALRDQRRENILLMQQYFLLYEELSWSMNEGDIGRVETLFPPWIYLF